MKHDSLGQQGPLKFQDIKANIHRCKTYATVTTCFQVFLFLSLWSSVERYLFDLRKCTALHKFCKEQLWFSLIQSQVCLVGISGILMDIISLVRSMACGITPIGVERSVTCNCWNSTSDGPKRQDTFVFSCILMQAGIPVSTPNILKNLSRRNVLCSCLNSLEEDS